MNEINFHTLTDRALADLIKSAMEEFQRRLSTPGVSEVKSLDEPVQIVSVPRDADIIFIRNCISKIRNSQYVHADMKDRYKEIYKKHESWFRSQGYPSDLRGSSVKRHAEYFTKKDK